MAESGGFSSAELAVSDARLALGILNYLRYGALQKAFGISREQANVLTFVLIAIALDGAWTAGGKVVRFRPPRLAGADAAIGAAAMREAVFSVTGPGVRQAPGLGALLAIAAIGGISLPVARRAAHQMNLAQHRLRELERSLRRARLGRYAAARAGARTAAASSSTPAASSRSDSVA
jgi:hypothetical protein